MKFLGYGSKSSPFLLLSDDESEQQAVKQSPSKRKLKALSKSGSDNAAQLPGKKRKRGQQSVESEQPVAGPSTIQRRPSPRTEPQKRASKRLKTQQSEPEPPVDSSLPQQSDSEFPFNSDWVNSMVKASESQVWDFPLWAPFPFFGSPIFPFHFGHVASAAPPINHAKSPNIIGMPREKDLNNRRSRFKISPSTIFEPPLPSYTPNPHTLVMDQLPKQCRSFEFIRDWGLKASGSTPLFIAIDSVSAKSLISFATADLAKRAWCSPRLALGEQKVPRLDLIRVWYLDASESLTFSMAEVKEGEITERDNAELHNAELVKSSDDKVDGEGKHADSNGKLNHHTSLANEKLLPVDSNTMDVDASTFIDIAPRMQSNLSLTPKGPPKGPKASILRNRVIEERIARNLQELEQQRAASSTPPVALSSALPTASSSPSKEELEARLRRLVQTTKKSKCALPSQTPALPQNVSQQDETTSAVLSAPLTLQPSASLDNSSLDDLATSFITATIETVKKNPLPPSPSSRLAALNEEIAQRSLLLTKLGATSDKAEKSRILAILRQLDRYDRLFIKRGLLKDTCVPSTKEPQTNLVKTVSVSRWPQTIGCILILSDDEDEDGED